MKTRIAMFLALALATAPLYSQTTQPKASTVSIAPAPLIGKTFTECEMALGKPARINTPKGSKESFSRYYTPASPGITQIQLETAYGDTTTGPAPDSVKYVHYYFPKGTVKTLGDALILVGVSPEGLSRPAATSTINATVLIADGVPGGLRTIWTGAAASANAPKDYNRHPNEDTLSFMIPNK